MESVLEIGCTHGTKLAGMLDGGLVRTAHGCDIAAGAVAQAERELTPMPSRRP